MDLRLDLVWNARTPLLEGALMTVWVALLALVVALLLGLPLAVLRMSRVKILQLPAFLYIQFFRGTALYVLILWVFFGLSIAIGLNLKPFQAAVICLGLLNSAYMAEVYRTGLATVGFGQWEAARSVGIGELATFRLVVLPQALRVIIPSAANLFVDMLKDAAIVGVVGVWDLMKQADRLTKFHFRPFEFYTASALIYFILVFLAARLVGILENRFSRHVVMRGGGAL
jgi:His/Glu/Gln/Arg/opine family amino acid ABC transporter permease subunit